MNELKKVLKIAIMSIVASFSMTFVLLIVNSLMKIFITIDYYFMIFNLLTIGLIIGLVLYESKSIFSKKKKRIKNKPSKSNISKKQAKVDTQSQVRKRKIS